MLTAGLCFGRAPRPRPFAALALWSNGTVRCGRRLSCPSLWHHPHACTSAGHPPLRQRQSHSGQSSVVPAVVMARTAGKRHEEEVKHNSEQHTHEWTAQEVERTENAMSERDWIERVTAAQLNNQHAGRTPAQQRMRSGQETAHATAGAGDAVMASSETNAELGNRESSMVYGASECTSPICTPTRMAGSALRPVRWTRCSAHEDARETSWKQGVGEQRAWNWPRTVRLRLLVGPRSVDRLPVVDLCTVENKRTQTKPGERMAGPCSGRSVRFVGGASSYQRQ